MLPLASATPTTAERIRSACARAGGALLALESRGRRAPAGDDPVATPIHHLLHDGSFAVAVPVDAPRPTTGSGSQALLELTDYAPLPLREPVRSLVWVRGRLQQVPPLRGDSDTRPDRRREPQPGAAASRDPEIQTGRPRTRPGTP